MNCSGMLLLLSIFSFGQSDIYNASYSRLELPPYGDLVFANQAFPADHFHSNPKLPRPKDLSNVLGLPDAIKTKTSFLNLDYGESVLLSFAEFPLNNSLGADVYIFSPQNPDNLEAFISENGRTWFPLGKVNSKKKTLNITRKPLSTVRYKYLKLKNKCAAKDCRAGLKIEAVALKLKGGDKRYYAINQDSLYLRAEETRIRVNDYRQTDGDRVALYVDGVEIKEILLGHIYSQTDLLLTPGVHSIYIKALNTGMLMPNTLNLQIVDGDKIHFGDFRLNKGKGFRLYLIKPE